jgi:hypothetical protein
VEPVTQEQAIEILAAALGWDKRKATIVWLTRDKKFYKYTTKSIDPAQLGELIRLNYPERYDTEY